MSFVVTDAIEVLAIDIKRSIMGWAEIKSNLEYSVYLSYDEIKIGRETWNEILMRLK
jgi:hypothetical protein